MTIEEAWPIVLEWAEIWDPHEECDGWIGGHSGCPNCSDGLQEEYHTKPCPRYSPEYVSSVIAPILNKVVSNKCVRNQAIPDICLGLDYEGYYCRIGECLYSETEEEIWSAASSLESLNAAIILAVAKLAQRGA